MNKNVLFPGVALAIGLGVGFGVGKTGAPKEDAAVIAEREMRNSRSGERGPDRDGEAARKKGARSVDEIYSKPGQSSRVQALLDFYSNLGPDEFASEAEKLDNLPLNERILAAVLLFGKWSEVDPTAAMAFTDTMGMAGAFVRPTVLQSWASTDPVNAAKYYAENSAQFAMMDMMGGGRGGRMGGQGAGQIIAAEWAKQDPKAAMEWAAGLKNNSAQAMGSVVSEVAKTDPKKAAEMAGKMDADSRGDAYESIAKQWGAQNFAEAQAWANGLPEDQRGAAMSAAIEGLAQTSPLIAAGEISKMTDKEAMRDAVPTVAKNYAREDLQGSMTWLNSIDDDKAKQDSMREVMPIWAAQDSKAAIGFISGQTSPDVKNSAAETYIWANRSSSVQEQLQVVDMISDEGSKARTTGIVAARWMQEDKPAATEFINNSPTIPDNMKERLISGQGMWGGDGGGRGRGR